MTSNFGVVPGGRRTSRAATNSHANRWIRPLPLKARNRGQLASLQQVMGALPRGPFSDRRRLMRSATPAEGADPRLWNPFPRWLAGMGRWETRRRRFRPTWWEWHRLAAASPACPSRRHAR